MRLIGVGLEEVMPILSTASQLCTGSMSMEFAILFPWFLYTSPRLMQKIRLLKLSTVP